MHTMRVVMVLMVVMVELVKEMLDGVLNFLSLRMVSLDRPRV